MTVLKSRVPISIINNNVKLSDDEESVCSTLTVERLNGGKQSLVRKSAVKFDFSRIVEYEAPEPLYEDELNELFYAKEDYKEFKASFISLAKQFQSYDRKISDPLSFKAVLIKAFKACDSGSEEPRSCRLEKADERALRSWLSKGSRRGVERISVLSILSDKSARRKKISAAVLDTQDSTKDMDYQAAAELIRQASVEISLPSRHFACRLAL